MAQRGLDEHHTTSVAWRHDRSWRFFQLLGVEVSLEPVRPLLAYPGWARTESEEGLIAYTDWVTRKPGSQPDGAANRNQPVRSETNRPSSSAGSGR